MKRNTFFITTLFLLFLMPACKKSGEIVRYPSYGNLSISGIFTSSLAVYVDEKSVDTLKDGLILRLEEGTRHISFVDKTNKTLLDTVLTLEKGKTVYLSDFFYAGYGLLLPDMDLTRKPSPGNMLVRFIITDKTLPDELNLSLSVYDFGTGAITPVTSLNGVRKDQFSDYIELENPADLPGASDPYYVIEGTDLNGNKVLSIDDNNFSFIFYDRNISPYIPNNILSIGIGVVPEDGSSTYHMPDVIFQRVAQ
jgi:hypothetical protein